MVYFKGPLNQLPEEFDMKVILKQVVGRNTVRQNSVLKYTGNIQK